MKSYDIKTYSSLVWKRERISRLELVTLSNGYYVLCEI